MSADFNEVANSAIEVELAGKKYKVRRVPLDTIFGRAEAAVISLQMKRIHEMANGLDGDDKSSFLAKAMLESLPTGQRLNEMSASYLRSVNGVKMVLVDALKTDQPNVEREIDIAKMAQDEPDKIATIVSFAIGRSDKKSSAPLASETAKVQ